MKMHYRQKGTERSTTYFLQEAKNEIERHLLTEKLARWKQL